MKKAFNKDLPSSSLRISLTSAQLENNNKETRKLDSKEKKTPFLERNFSDSKFFIIPDKRNVEKETDAGVTEKKIKSLILKREIFRASLQKKKNKYSPEIIENIRNQLITEEIEKSKNIKNLLLDAYELNDKIKKLIVRNYKVTNIVKILIDRKHQIYEKIKFIENIIFSKRIKYRIFIIKLLNYQANIEEKIEKERILIPELIKAIHKFDLYSIKMILRAGVVFEEYKNEIEEYEKLDCRNYGIKLQKSNHKNSDSLFYRKFIHKEKEISLMRDFLIEIVLTNNKILLKILLAHGMDINTILGEKTNLLQVTISQRNFVMCSYLLKKGADPDQKNENGENALDRLYKIFKEECQEEENLKFAKIIMETSIKRYFHQKNGESISDSLVTLGKENLRKLYLDLYKNHCEMEGKTLSYYGIKNAHLSKLRSQSL